MFLKLKEFSRILFHSEESVSLLIFYCLKIFVSCFGLFQVRVQPVSKWIMDYIVICRLDCYWNYWHETGFDCNILKIAVLIIGSEKKKKKVVVTVGAAGVNFFQIISVELSLRLNYCVVQCNMVWFLFTVLLFYFVWFGFISKVLCCCCIVFDLIFFMIVYLYCKGFIYCLWMIKN
jgi:hypothetical protein